MAKMAPAATAVVAAMTSALNHLNTTKPINDAMPKIIAMPDQIEKIYLADLPAFFIPAALNNPSGTLDKKMAMTATMLTPPDASPTQCI